MGSIGKQLKKALAVVLSMALAVALNPAAAFAQTKGAITHSETGEIQPDISTGEPQNIADGGQASTAVYLGVTTNFAVTSEQDAFIMGDATDAAQPGRYVWKATAKDGVKIGSGNGEYLYKITRTDAKDTSATPSVQQVWPEQSQGEWASVAIEAGEERAANIEYDFSKDKLQRGDIFNYTITVKDGSNITREVRASVSCGSNYNLATINGSGDYSNVSVYGTVYGRGSIFDNSWTPATDLAVTPVVDATLNLMQNMVPGYKISGTYNMTLASEAASDADLPAYLSLNSVTFPIEEALTSEQRTSLSILCLVKKTEEVEGATRVHYEVEQLDLGSGCVRIAPDGKSVTLVPGGDYALAEPFAFAVAYKIPDDQKVTVISEVAVPEGGQAGGSIDKLGTNTYAAGTKVPFTFLPWAGYELTSVKVKVDNGEAIEQMPLTNGADNTANCLAYTVPNGAKSVTITVGFTSVPKDPEAEPWDVTATVLKAEDGSDATGSIKLTNARGTTKTSTASQNNQTVTAVDASAVVAEFAGEGTAILDKAYVDGEEVTPVNGIYTLSAVKANTTITASFKYGYQPIYPDVSVKYESGEGGKFADGQVSTIEYGKSLSIGVVPDEANGYTIKRVYYKVSGSDAEQPTRFNGTTYIIDSVTSDITVYAEFMTKAASINVDVGAHGSAEITYTNTEGDDAASITIPGGETGKTETITDILATSTSVTMKVTPETGYKIDSIVPDATAVEGVYAFTLEQLTQAGGITVRFIEEISPGTSADVDVTVPETGVSAKRVLASGSTLIESGSSTLTVSDPKQGLKLDVQLVNSDSDKYVYSNLKVSLYDGDTFKRDITAGVDNVYTLTEDDLKLIDPKIVITRDATEKENPPAPELFTVEANVSYGTNPPEGVGGCTISTTDKTTFNPEDTVTPITYTMKVPSDEYTLEMITFTGSPDTVNGSISYPNSAISYNEATRTYTYTLPADRIESGVRSVLATFKYTPKTNHTITVQELDATTGAVLAAESRLGTTLVDGLALAADSFQKLSTATTNFTFKPKDVSKSYKVEYRTFPTGKENDSGYTLPEFSELTQKQFVLGITTGDTTVQVRYVPDSSSTTVFHDIAVEYDAATGSVKNGTGTVVDANSKLSVANLGNATLTFVPANGYQFTYVVIDETTVLTRSDALQTFSCGSLTGDVLRLTGITEGHTVKVVFGRTGTVENLIVYNVQAAQSSGGSGTVSPTGQVLVDKTAAAGKTVQITPDAGSRIASIVLAGKTISLTDAAEGFSGSATSGGVFTLPKTGTGGTLTVTFEPMPQETVVHVFAGKGGTVSPSGDTPAFIGATQTFDFFPNSETTPKYDLDRVMLTLPNGTQKDITAEVKAGTGETQKYSYKLNVTGETIIDVTFKQLEEGEQPGYGDIEKDRIAIVTVEKTTGGTVSPSDSKQLIREDSSRTFIFMPDSGYELADVLLGSTSVKNRLSKIDGTLLLSGADALRAADSAGNVTLRAVFAETGTSGGNSGAGESNDITVNISSSSGGTTYPTKATVTPGGALPIAFINDDGFEASEMQLTYRMPDGTTKTVMQKVGGTGTVIDPVPANLIDVMVVFTQKAGTTQAKTRSVKVEVQGGHGSTTPASGTVAKATAAAPAYFKLKPDAGYRAASAALDGQNLIDAGDTEVFVPFDRLSDNIEKSLVVKFEQIPAEEEDGYVDVDIAVNVNVNVNIETDMSAWDDKNKGTSHAVVSPDNIRISSKDYDPNQEFTFYIYPEDGYKLTALAYKYQGDTKANPLAYQSTKNPNAATNNVGTNRAGGTVPANNVGVPIGMADDDAVQTHASGTRCYIFKLKGVQPGRTLEILGNIASMEKLAEAGLDASDDALGIGTGNSVDVRISSSAGGWISPSGDQTFPAGTKYPFMLQAAGAGKQPTGIKITYGDGRPDKILTAKDDGIKNGYNIIEIEEGMTGIYAQFEDAGSSVETVVLTTTSEGTGGSMSPAGATSIEKGKSQSLTFTYSNQKGYLKELHVGGVDLVANGAVSKFATSYTLLPYQTKSDVSVRAVFAVGGEADPVNPNYNAVTYTISTEVWTGNSVSSAGGSVSPTSRVVSEGGGQQFLFEPNEGYMLDSVSVIRNGVVEDLGASVIAERKYTVSNATGNITLQVKFVSHTYTVNVSHSEGGTVVPKGDVAVQQGQPLILMVTPNTGYETGDFQTSGFVMHKAKANSAKSLEGQNASEVAVAQSRAANEETFTVAGAGRVHVPFTRTSDEPGPGPTPGGDDPDNPNTPSTTETVTVKASSAGHGTISPAGTFERIKGSTVTFTLAADSGYVPVSVTYKPESGSEKTVAVTGRTANVTVDDNCEVVANFSLPGVAASNSPTARAMRYLQSLAATGDAQRLGILGLTALACAGLGVALLSNNRRRKGNSGVHSD